MKQRHGCRLELLPCSRPPGGKKVRVGRNGGDDGTHHRIAIRDHLVQLFQEPIIDDELWLEIVQFCNAEGCRLADIRVLISQAFLKRVT